MKTRLQKTPFTFTVTVDQKTAARLAVHAQNNPAQYAAGLLMRTLSTADALGVKPHELPSAAVMAYATGAI